MYNYIRTSRHTFKWSGLLLCLLLCSFVLQAQAADLSVIDQQSRQLQPGEIWTLHVSDTRANFLEIQNAGFDTATSVLTEQGSLLSQSASWRGREGRYIVSLTDKKGGHAAKVEVRSLENRRLDGQVRVVWLQVGPGEEVTSLRTAEGYFNLARGASLHYQNHDSELAHSQAARAYQNALSALSESVLDAWAGHIYFELGVINRHKGLLQESASNNQSSLMAFRLSNDRKGMAAASNALGMVAYANSEFDQALQYFYTNLSLRNAANEHFFRARAHNNIGLTLWKLDQYENALQAYERALPLFAGYGELSVDQVLGLDVSLIEAEGNLSEVSNTLNNLALANSTIGQAEQAENIWLHSIVIAEATNDSGRIAQAQLNLGKLYSEQGQLENALTYLDKAANYYGGSSNDSWHSETLIGIGNVYASINEYVEAISYYQQALRLASSQDSQSSALRLLAKANWQIGNTALADSQFNEAKSSFIHSNQHGQASLVASEHAMLLYEQGKSKEAIQNQSQAMFTLQSLGNVRDAARAQSRLGQLLLAQGEYDEAEQNLESALIGHRAVSDELFELDTLTALSRAQSGVAALNTAKAATELADTIRTRTNSTDIQTSFLASRRGAFEQYINLLVDAGHIEHAWNVNEQIRARTLLDLIQDSNHPDNRLAAVSTNLDIPALQQELGSDVAMLSYYLGEQRSHLWVIASDSMEYYPLPAAGEINLAANELTEVLRSHRQSPSRIAYVAGQLSDMVLRPAMDAIADRELVVVADGGLQLIPFALLPMDTTDATLITQTNVTYTPSARIFNLLNESSNQPSSDILVLADPLANQPVNSILQAQDAFADTNIDFSNVLAQRSLSQTGVNLARLPGARLEAQAIAETANRANHGNAINVMTGAQANHDFVINGGLRNYGVLHFATHGVVDADVPELSGLVLAQEQETENMSYLRPHEIAALELDADLVVLSGCETGIGKSVGSEGLFSLSRPFLIAGARQVISSLWQVSDRATALLMERFYFHLLEEDQSPEVALRSAQQWLSSQPEWQHPYFWAGFVVQGGRNLPAMNQPENQQYAGIKGDIEVSVQDTQSPPPTLVNAAL